MYVLFQLPLFKSITSRYFNITFNIILTIYFIFLKKFSFSEKKKTGSGLFERLLIYINAGLSSTVIIGYNAYILQEVLSTIQD